MNPIKAMVIDDSATMRALVRAKLTSEDGIVVVGEASNAAEGRQKIKALNPDVITLDVEMPGMDGIDFLEKIMRLRPMPVIMVSTLTEPGAETTIEALEIGAFECVAKPNGRNDTNFSQLPQIVREAVRSRSKISMDLHRENAANRGMGPVHARHRNWPEIVAIGASTGGVEALITLLSGFPKDCPPTVIVQHMPESFTASFAKRLDRLSPPTVKEAQEGDLLETGHVYLARGGRHLIVRNVGSPRCTYRDYDPVQGHRPSVDVLFKSVSEQFGDNVSGVLLTGMGRDGADGLRDIRTRGGRTIAQDENSSLVYGMPRVAKEIGAVDRGTPLKQIASDLFKG